MRFEKIILHAGLGKTGSTAIQQSLLRHSAFLESQCGILFPDSFEDPRPFAGNHSVYLRSLSSDNPQDLRVNLAAGLGDKESVVAADDALRAQYLEKFSSSSADTLLLSAEGVGHFDTASTYNLAQWLFSFTDHVEVIACVRHPRHALAAEIQQRLKTGARLERLYQKPPFYQYSVLFSALSGAFGKESLRLYDYAEVVSSPAGAVGTFFQKIGLDLPEEAPDADIVNAALSLEATLLLDSLNRQRPLLLNGERNALRRPGDLAAFARISGGVYRPPAEVFRLLDELAADEVSWLADHYGLILDPMESSKDSTELADSTRLNFDITTIDELALRVSESD